MNLFNFNFVDILLSLPAVIWAISFHEVCHGWASWKLGDPTARSAGRLTLNPLAHFDLWGTLSLLFFRFGWAKPVPIDPRYYKNPKRDLIIVSLAGVAGNLLSAFLAGQLVQWLYKPVALGSIPGGLPLIGVLQYMVIINTSFALFNLIPIPPLDGSKVLWPLLPAKWQFSLWRYERYGSLILMVLVFSGAVGRLIGPAVFSLFRLFTSPLLS